MAITVGVVVALQYKELLAVTHTLRIGHCERRFTHREVIDCIDDVPNEGAAGHHTYGNMPAEAMLTARDVMVERVVRIAREVFK